MLLEHRGAGPFEAPTREVSIADIPSICLNILVDPYKGQRDNKELAYPTWAKNFKNTHFKGKRQIVNAFTVVYHGDQNKNVSK